MPYDVAADPRLDPRVKAMLAAIKQVVPYAKFLVRASMEKRRPSPDVPAPPAAAAAQSTSV